MALYKRGSIFWYSFTWNKERYQESTGLTCRKAALEVEAGRRVQLAKHEVGLTDRPRFTVGELLDRLKLRWQLERKTSAQNLSLLKTVKADFGAKLADDLTAQDFELYALRRRKLGYAAASTNRTFQCLRRAFSLAGVPWPKFELLNEKHNVREGFLSSAQMSKLLAALPDDGLRDYVDFCWCTGMRKGEAASLRWSFIHDGQLVVPPEFCKSRKPHVIPLAGPLAAILKRREAARAFKSNGTTQLAEFIFHRGGVPIREFRKSWKTACTVAGCGNTVFHDLRRSAVRDLVRAGVPQSVAMKISGHRTAAMFQRYDITAAEDVTIALEKTAAYRAG
jgi:integrase